MGRGRLVLSGLLLLVGCSGDVQLPGQTDGASLDLPVGPVAVKRVERDAEEKEIEVTLTTNQGERRVSMRPSLSRPLPLGLSAELSDDSGVLYSVTIAWDPQDPDRSWLEEKTNTNVLTALMRRVGGRLVETYNIDGDVFEVDYPALDPEDRRRAILHHRNGWQPDSPDMVEFVEKYHEFVAYYAPHEGNTLHNNADGELLVSLLMSEPFVAMATGAKDGGGPARLPDPADKICTLAALCARLKCMAGGLVNPLCVACSGTATACLIATIVCWFLNCD